MVQAWDGVIAQPYRYQSDHLLTHDHLEFEVPVNLYSSVMLNTTEKFAMNFIKKYSLNSVPDTPPILSILSAALSHNDLLSDSEQHSIHSLVSDYKDDLASVAS